MEADYVIVGAGSAGCVLAERLSADGASVLLLEAGPPDTSPFIRVPAGVVKLINHPVYDWKYRSAAEPNADGRVINLPRGRVLGGTSSINGMKFVRGHPSDFDGWAQMGCRGWSYADLLPHFKAIESFEGGDDAYRGRTGPMKVAFYDTILPITHRFVEAARQAGYPLSPDLNGATTDGICYSQMSRRGRFRHSSATAFLGRARGRNNLRIETGVLATRLLFDGRRCVGVAGRRDGQDFVARARREVIVSGGSINSPQLLQLSGIGPAAHLQKIGVEVIHDLPGVGSNLSDHYAVPVTARVKDATTINQLRRFPRIVVEMAKWALAARGALTFGATSASVFARSRPDLASPDLQLMLFPGSFTPLLIGPPVIERDPGIRVSVSLARPRSRGSIMAVSPDPATPPDIHLNYLADPDDIRALMSGIRQVRNILTQKAIAPHIVVETGPGSEAQSDADLLPHIRATGTTVHHLVGTCRMGEDDRAVVDSRLRVRGIGGLRVVDASVMPQVTTGNTNAPTIMIGDKGAAMIREDAKA